MIRFFRYLQLRSVKYIAYLCRRLHVYLTFIKVGRLVVFYREISHRLISWFFLGGVGGGEGNKGAAKILTNHLFSVTYFTLVRLAQKMYCFPAFIDKI